MIALGRLPLAYSLLLVGTAWVAPAGSFKELQVLAANGPQNTTPEFRSADDPLKPAPLQNRGAPLPRTPAECQIVINSSDPSEKAASGIADPFHIVLCAGPKDHGPGEHDYPLWQKRWSRLLALARNVQVSSAWEWPSPQQFQEAQAVVFYSDNPGWNTNRAAELDSALARGCGLVFIHWAVDGHSDVDALAERIGLAWQGSSSRFRHGPLDLQLQPGPFTRGLGAIHFVDESYWNLVGNTNRIDLLGSAVEQGSARPLVWTRTVSHGRVFVNILGHYTWTFDDPLFRLLVLRGICWAGGQPIDRLSALALVGARIEGTGSGP
jgi:type 1 glutamine amidotransferase